MRDRLSVMLDSMITAVDEGLSFDGIVSMPEKGLENFGYRSGLTGLFDDSVELVRKTKTTVSRAVNRIISRGRVRSTRQARRHPDNDNRNSYANFRDSKFDPDDKNTGGAQLPPPAPQSMQESQASQNSPAPQESPVQQSFPASRDSSNLSPQDSAASQDSPNPNPHGTGQPRKTRSSLGDSPTQALQKLVVSQESQRTQQPRKALLSSQESPMLPPQGSTASQASHIDVENSPGEGESIVQPGATYEVARPGGEQVPEDTARQKHEETRSEDTLPRLRRAHEEMLPRLQRGREESGETRPSAEEILPSRGDEHAHDDNQKLIGEQGVQKLNVGQSSSIPGNAERQPRRQETGDR